MKKIFIWGASGQAIVLKTIAEEQGYVVTWIFDNNTKINSPFINVSLVGDWKAFRKWSQTISHRNNIGFTVAIGSERSGKDRITLQNKIEKLGFRAITLIHKSSLISDEVRIGVGTQILRGAMICERVSIGKACIINTGAQVD